MKLYIGKNNFKINYIFLSLKINLFCDFEMILHRYISREALLIRLKHTTLDQIIFPSAFEFKSVKEFAGIFIVISLPFFPFQKSLRMITTALESTVRKILKHIFLITYFRVHRSNADHIFIEYINYRI